MQKKPTWVGLCICRWLQKSMMFGYAWILAPMSCWVETHSCPCQNKSYMMTIASRKNGTKPSLPDSGMLDFDWGEYVVDQDRPFDPANSMITSACSNKANIWGINHCLKFYNTWWVFIISRNGPSSAIICAICAIILSIHPMFSILWSVHSLFLCFRSEELRYLQSFTQNQSSWYRNSHLKTL